MSWLWPRNGDEFRLLFSLLFFLFLATHLYAGSAPPLPPELRGWRLDTYTSPAPLTALKKSIDHYDAKRYKEARAALAAIKAPEKTDFGDYILLYRAKISLALQQAQPALDDFRLLARNYPDSLRLRDAIMGQCQALLVLKKYAEITDLLGKYPQYSGAETSYYQARVCDGEGNKEKAEALYLQIYAKYPTASFASLARDYLLKLAPGALSGANNYLIRLQRAENLVRRKDYTAARQLLLALGQYSAPNDQTAQRRNLLRVESDYHLNHTTAALNRLGKLKLTNPDMKAKAIYLEGLCRRRLKQEKSLVALRDKALRQYPASPHTEELCYTLANWYDSNYDAGKARDAYRTLLRAFPRGKHTERAQWQIAMSAWIAKDYVTAAREFHSYLLANAAPAEAGPALYWLGRCHVRLGQRETAAYLLRRARELGHNGYYGQRALEAEAELKAPDAAPAAPEAIPAETGIDFSRLREFCDHITLPAVTLPDPDAAATGVMRRAGQLSAASLGDLAIAELRREGERHPHNRAALDYVIASVSTARGNFYDAISTLRRVFPNYSRMEPQLLPREVRQLFYPTIYSDLVARHAKRSGVEAALIMGLIRQESAFKATARSRANARGLMQLLPSTALSTAASAKVSRNKARDLYNPEINITLGVTYFSILLRNYGKPELALAAYNAGGGRVTRWLKEFGKDDMAEFVERIPFTETRNYVKQVLGNAAQYRVILAGTQ